MCRFNKQTVNEPCLYPVRPSYRINNHRLVCNLSGLVQLQVCAKFLADLECYVSKPSNNLWLTVHAKIESKHAGAQRLYLNSRGLCLNLGLDSVHPDRFC